MSIILELKKNLEDNIKYSKEDIIHIIQKIFIVKKCDNNIQKSLYIKIRMKELKQNNDKRDLYKIALNDYNTKSI